VKPVRNAGQEGGTIRSARGVVARKRRQSLKRVCENSAKRKPQISPLRSVENISRRGPLNSRSLRFASVGMTVLWVTGKSRPRFSSPWVGRRSMNTPVEMTNSWRNWPFLARTEAGTQQICHPDRSVPGFPTSRPKDDYVCGSP
jgi:hypothetical protein